MVYRYSSLTSQGSNQPNIADITRDLVKLFVLIHRITSHFRITYYLTMWTKTKLSEFRHLIVNELHSKWN